jgi:hypothetical protein
MLTCNLLNFLNGLFLVLILNSPFKVEGVQITKQKDCDTKDIEPRHTAWLCRLAYCMPSFIPVAKAQYFV